MSRRPSLASTVALALCSTVCSTAVLCHAVPRRRECGEDESRERPALACLPVVREAERGRPTNVAPAPWREPVPACLPAEPEASRRRQRSYAKRS